MYPVLSAAAMRDADRRTIEWFGIPGFTLMESAGRAAASLLEEHMGPLSDKRILCLCGKGNNGGDGFVLARTLATRAARIHVCIVAPPSSADAQLNFEVLQKMAASDGQIQLSIEYFQDLDRLDALPSPDIIVDALLGTGVQDALRAPYSDLVEWVNRQHAFVLAMDIPTGLNADTGAVPGSVLRADLTVAMGAYKTGLCIGQGPRLAGKTHVAEIGIPSFILESKTRQHGCASIPSLEAIRSWLPVRPPDAHKYSVGMALVVAGSPGLTGAATLASSSAEQSGAGAIVCAAPEEIQPILSGKMTEVMTLGLPHTAEGIDTEQALERLAPTLSKASSVLIGCGMGQLEHTQAFIRTLATSTNLPVVLDADGLNAFQRHTELIAEHSGGKWILTPHLGEFKRLAGADVNLDNKIEIAREFAQTWNSVLILKGAPSLVATPEGDAFINPTGNNALATAGTGDVLAGFCAGLLAQGLSSVQAALCALHIGGAAAEYFSVKSHPSTMRASDLIAHLPVVLSDLYYI